MTALEAIWRARSGEPARGRWQAGTDPDYLRELVTYWHDDFDWWARERPPPQSGSAMPDSGKNLSSRSRMALLPFDRATRARPPLWKRQNRLIGAPRDANPGSRTAANILRSVLFFQVMGVSANVSTRRCAATITDASKPRAGGWNNLSQAS